LYDLVSRSHYIVFSLHNLFTGEEITTFEVLTNLVSREADSPIFTRLGLSYGKAVKLQEEFAYLRRADGNSLRNNKLTIATSPKPTMTALSNVDAATRQLYLARYVMHQN